MNTTIATLLVIALVAANLPFLLERILFVSAPKGGQKGFAWRVLELVLLYFLVGGVGLLLAKKIGPLQHQGWEFYAVTACVFIVMAYPGFVYRYLWRR
ncbi:MAG: DUF2818 family protein [Pseudomonadota bacterium]